MLPPSSRLCFQIGKFNPLRYTVPSATDAVCAKYIYRSSEIPNVFVTPRFCSGVTSNFSVWLKLMRRRSFLRQSYAQVRT
ncbi:hypothetical protein Plhal304r1_c041g0119031 [Plasmopara halstedii]